MAWAFQCQIAAAVVLVAAGCGAEDRSAAARPHQPSRTVQAPSQPGAAPVADAGAPDTVVESKQQHEDCGLPDYTNAPSLGAPEEAVAVSFVIDRSGSMTGAPFQNAKKAVRSAVAQLRSHDWVNVVWFDSAALETVPLQRAKDADAIGKALDDVHVGGGTEITAGLVVAYTRLARLPSTKKHVLLVTDGGSPSACLDELVRRMVAKGVTLSTLALGERGDGFLEAIARTGNGRYHAALRAEQLEAVFRGELAALGR
jgi:Mg-chelatase subunit ChlD